MGIVAFIDQQPISGISRRFGLAEIDIGRKPPASNTEITVYFMLVDPGVAAFEGGKVIFPGIGIEGFRGLALILDQKRQG